MASEIDSSMGAEEGSIGEAALSGQPLAQPQAEGRRTQLKIVREKVQTLSKDVGTFRKSHEASTKRLDSQISSLRKELAAHASSKELSNHAKAHEAGSKRIEKQVATLRSELAALKIHIDKETARNRAREEATLSRILAKVSARPSAPAKRAKTR